VVLEALDEHGNRYRREATGLKARAIQHEIDHLDGILFLAHLSAVKRSLLLSKWKKARKGQTGYLKEVTPEPAGEL
jgi:peptide deformylase